MELRRASAEDIPYILSAIEEARAFQLSYGNMQWAEGYPSPSLIEEDISAGIGYVIRHEEMTAGYLAIVDHDDSYDSLEGAWITEGPYIALHRIAFSDAFRGRGLFPALIGCSVRMAAERGAISVRIDTDRRNPVMQHLLDKLGFSHTGYVLFEGDRKLAYELPVSSC